MQLTMHHKISLELLNWDRKVKWLLISGVSDYWYRYLASDKPENKEEKEQLKSILADMKLEYTRIYAHAYNMYVNSLKELKGRPNVEEFIITQVREQSKRLNFY